MKKETTNQDIEQKKSNRGRKPITYSKEDLERQPMLVLVCGETGVGKTYRNVTEIRHYMKDDASTGRKGRKVLAFDVNDDDYPMFPTVSPFHIKALTKVQARRIRPIAKSGQNMSIEEKREVVQRMVNQFKNGLLVLEDLDKYMVGAKGQTVVGLLTTNRHNGLDIMISHQSIAKITTTEWQNCTWLRLHHQVDDVSRYESRIPNYFLVRIATYIVDEQYNLANNAFADGSISKDEYKKRRSFFVYVDMRRLKIRGCSRDAFIRSCKKFIDTEDQRKIRMMLQERDHQDKPLYKNRSAATVKLITEYLRHHETGPNSPFAS
ncbi:zonular occludens toxin domain-containing protein [Pseudotamlana carrageenivorans]|uniref:Zona occludens toxin N-terminal domain-containing protein n=1 Tax=Pseudotamlana carrageenivorans TaxID=2069432 RepID=A0A2I7SGF7_9FLAO|nr:zonular occludens toxin domain-containing protein [Tamlana carrageenivorans]AUS04965.1 hypothetical protein C1A40_05535 [Tamlana carrageenivorans]